ncbi:pre-mRNA-splicing factor rse1 [Coemansia sp. RSA 2050]|nr:pre-mRNA-splicing factor rse1 [Coemansia sp. RSA 2050]KAJ2730766.1 pre-mRNA-splicing factor rse1 [Coemansia sp. BCRC 34962]
MFLYNLTLQPASAVGSTVLGHFSGEKHQELVVARGHQRLELWRPNTTTGKLSVEHSEDLFCRIRGLTSFRMAGGSKDYIVIGGDTGALAVLEFNGKERRFVTVQYHEFGRTGLRRLVAGQYVASDPRGRAVMVAAVERSKIVYIITRDSEARLMLASPLEANRSGSVCFDVVGVDVGYENPVFAAIESNYENGESGKQLVYYELDLGLNHVVRKWSAGVDDSAHRLIALPGGGDGPSGVLVCFEGRIEYRHFGGGGDGGEVATHSVPIPRRVNPLEDTGRGLLVVASAVHRMKNAFFILAQAETGDLYKITVDFAEGCVQRVGIKYFDTLAAPSSSICILKAGFLFAAAGGESGGSHQLFQFENLGDEVESEEYFSTEWDQSLSYFQPHELSSLALVDEIEGACPVLRSQVLHVAAGEEAPQIYAACGAGAQSSLKIMRHGAEVSELAVSELPATPCAVWTVAHGESDQLIVVGFAGSTLVLAMGEGDELAEADDALGVALDEATLAVCGVEGGGLVHVTPRAVRHIMPDGRVTEWAPPGVIACAAVNARQAVVALARSGGQCAYFEMDALGVLREHAERLTVGSDVTCVALAPVPATRLLAPLVAVGCEDQTVRVHGLEPHRCLEALSMQAVADVVHSVAVVDHGLGGLALYAGLRNGLLVRAQVDPVSGDVDDTRTRFLGARAVQLCPASGQSVVALSAAPWLCHVQQGRVRTTPLSYDMLDYAAPLGEGMVCVAGASLRILSIDRLGASAALTCASIPLAFTPRGFCVHPVSRFFAVIEAENGRWAPAHYAARLAESGAVAGEEEAAQALLPPEQFGLVPNAGGWASLVRVLSPFDGETAFADELPPGHAALCIAPVRFAADPQAVYVAVGCAAGLRLRPRACDSASIRLYKWTAEGSGLELVHVTPLDDGVPPQALLEFNGMLMVAAGRGLALFDLGIRRLLKKAQSAVVAPHMIAGVQGHPTHPDRWVFVSDVQESVLLVAFNHVARAFNVIVDDSLPRHITCMRPLEDGFTVVAGDKFGSLFVLRAPEAVVRSLEGDPSGGRLVYEKPRMAGADVAPYCWQSVAEFHVADIVTSIDVCALAPHARPVILYTTLLGSVHVAVPMVSQGDVDFFAALEAAIRKHCPPISGRDHLAFRSSFTPVRAVVDGDLCESFYLLTHEQRELVSDAVDRTQQDILKKMEDVRSMFAF